MNKVQPIAVAAAILLIVVGCRGALPRALSGHASSAASSSSATATAWTPTEAVKVIIAFKQGSGTDTSARLLLKNAKKYIGQSLVVENHEGADGKIGYTALARAKADGYTIGFINLPTFTILALEPDSPFSIKGVVPICNHLLEPSAVVVKRESPYNTLDDLVAACKVSELKCSTNGYMASNHVGAQILAKAAGFGYKAIPYGGTAEQLQALSQDEVAFSVPKVGDVTSMVTGDNAELRMLAVFSESRLAQYPDVPTLKELGLTDTWYGSARALVAPANTPQAIIDFYAEAFKKTMEDQACIADHKAAGLSMHYMDPVALADLLTAQDAFCRDTVVELFQH
ncbi:MAG: tripartite tricarboxylate transporter substrate binding protein [Candidatus Fimivivens sp.]